MHIMPLQQAHKDKWRGGKGSVAKEERFLSRVFSGVRGLESSILH